jgi:hypothetical protein
MKCHILAGGGPKDPPLKAQDPADAEIKDDLTGVNTYSEKCPCRPIMLWKNIFPCNCFATYVSPFIKP